MVSTPWSTANATSDSPSDVMPFSLEGQKFPSYPTFREVLNQQIFAAKERVCILTQRLDDRELSFTLFSASRRAVYTALRILVQKTTTEREEQRLEEFSFLGLQILKKPLIKLKMQDPTLLTIDGRAWSVSSELNEFSASEVNVEPAPLTAAEVCRWAEDAASAKATTRR